MATYSIQLPKSHCYAFETVQKVVMAPSSLGEKTSLLDMYIFCGYDKNVVFSTALPDRVERRFYSESSLDVCLQNSVRKM